MFSAAIKSGSAAAPKDPQFNYVTMLLHGDGTNGAQNNTFLDSSANNFSITRNGNTTQGTFTPYGSNWGNYFPTASINTSSSGLIAGTNTFTIEFWIFPTAGTTDDTIIDTRTSNGADSTAWLVGLTGLSTGDGVLKWLLNGTGNASLGGTVPKNQWSHIAVTRNSSNVITGYVNGVATGTTQTDSRNLTNTNFLVGGNVTTPTGTWYLSNVRWVVGSVVYSSNFTPSTTPLTAITNTKLLTCQSNRYVDNSTNGYTFTQTGSPSVQRFSPFSPTSAYSTSVIGGSAYFDGTGDYLQTPSSSAFNFSATDCTLEFWYYGAGSGGLVFEFGSSAPDTAAMQCEFSSGTLTFKPIGASSSFFAIQPNAWNYIAAVKTGTTYYLYINGTRNTSSTGTAASTGQIINIGARNGGSVAPITGYLSDFRVSNTARYTAATMTVPTTPSTVIANTQLMLNYTNAGILDNAEMNDLETVGNAQISTSVKKYGTGSISFNGSTDKLVSPYFPWMDFGTGNFTIEMWIYFNVALSSQTNNAGIVTYRSASLENTSLNLRCLTTNNIAIQLGGTSSSFAWTPSATTWYHLALSRSGSNLYMFVNGTQQGSTATNSGNVAFETGYVFTVGGNPAASVFLNGYIDDLRITKGYARYTSNFTAPTAAFPNN